MVNMRNKMIVRFAALIALIVFLMVMRHNNITNKMDAWKRCTDVKSCDIARLAYVNSTNLIFHDKQ